MPRGLVLCGGGSKGSYEMGAWTALKELNEEFDIVTGTSIGCLMQRCLHHMHMIDVKSYGIKLKSE